jgi:peptidyl-prolyl cis-trans isomerase C
MRPLPTGWLAVALAMLAGAGAADPVPEAPTVARVGSYAVTADELGARMQSMPAVQLAALGPTDVEIRRATLEKFVVQELRYALAAHARRLDETDGVKERIDGVLRTARVRSLREQLVVSAEDVARYYDEHRSMFEAPPRVGLWRILCASLAEAKVVHDRARAGLNAWGWKDLARDHSIDNATKYRGGDLGFVAADGSSSEPSVKVNPALYAAAQRVKDGELLGEPIEEGSGWAVVWRRESMPAARRTLEQEADAIRQVIVRRKLEQAVGDLVRTLRRATRIETKPELVRLVEVTSSGQLKARTRPAVTPRPSQGSPVPSPSGLR